MAEPALVRLPALLVALFPGAERVLALEADSVREMIDALTTKTIFAHGDSVVRCRFSSSILSTASNFTYNVM